MNLTDKKIINIALPSIVSNITVPLLGLIDVAIVGHLGAAEYIGAITVGGLLFSIAYWMFGFLRMGTSGMTSQALGSGNTIETAHMAVRSVSIALGIAIMLLLLQSPLRDAGLALIGPDEEVQLLAVTYYDICIWGAPAMLSLYALTGWFIGMQNSWIPMTIAIVQNIVNIIASLLLVFVGGMKVEGVALGTLIAQWAGLATALVMFAWKYGRQIQPLIKWNKQLWERSAMVRFFNVNRDIFLRTLCLIATTLFFTSAGASQGKTILAVNALFMQLFTLYSYVMDGFAFAGEALIGKAIGANDRAEYHTTVKRLFLWGIIMTTAYTLVYTIGGQPFLSLLTDETSVIQASADYIHWACLIPICGMAAFIWDGIYIGATATRGMLIAMASATALFFLLHFTLLPHIGNHGLWIAFLSYLLTRGIVLTLMRRSVWKI